MIFLAFGCGFLACMLSLWLSKLVFGTGSSEDAIRASEKGLRGDMAGALFDIEKKLMLQKGDVDTRILKIIEDTNKSLATLQAQISSNPYYEFDGKQRHKTVLPEAVGMPADDAFKMSNGAGGI